MPFDEDTLTQAREQAAQCWCTPETSGVEMDVRVAEAFAQRLAGWMEEARRYAANADFWRAKCEANIPDDVVSDRH